jgi:hypothetical protein
MAVLPDADRFAVWRDVQAETPAGETYGALTKGDLRAVVDAVDTWVNANASAFNSAIPEPGRTQLTAKQKARILMYVVSKRFDVGV